MSAAGPLIRHFTGLASNHLSRRLRLDHCCRQPDGLAEIHFSRRSHLKTSIAPIQIGYWALEADGTLYVGQTRRSRCAAATGEWLDSPAELGKSSDQNAMHYDRRAIVRGLSDQWAFCL